MGKLVLSLLCVVAFAAAVYAQPAATTNYNAFIGGSDAIVLGSVETAVIPALPVAGGGGGGGMTGQTGNATVSLKVTKVYTGTITDATLNLTIPLRVNRPGGGGPGGGGAAAPTAWTPDVSVGKVVVIGLVKTQAGWGMTTAAAGGGGGIGGILGGGATSVYPEANATAIATAIAAFPAKATLTAPTAPLTIGDKVTFTITVKNSGTAALTLGNVTLASTQESKLTSPATFTLVSSDVRDAAGAARTVAAGAEATISAVFTVVGPANYQMFDAKVFPMASQLSATVNLTQPRAGGGGGGGGFGGTALIAKTAWVDAQLVAPKP